MTTNRCGYDTSNDDARSVTKHARRLFEYAVPKISRMDKREEFGGFGEKKEKRKRIERSTSRKGISDPLATNYRTYRQNDRKRSCKNRAIDEMRLVSEGNYANPWRRTAKGTGTKGSRAESEKLASRFERDTRSKEGEMRANARCKGTTSGREKEAEEKGRS